jgi:dephospho-CoA kinase
LKKLILGIVGEQGGGKDAVSSYLASRYGAAAHRFSDPINECLKELGIENRRENQTMFSSLMRRGSSYDEGWDISVLRRETIVACLKRLHLLPTEEFRNRFQRLVIRHYGGVIPGFGRDVFSAILAERCEREANELVALNGIRLMPDAVDFTGLDGFRMLYVTAPADVRYERVKKRGDRPGEIDMTWEQFQAVETSETEVEIPDVGRIAQFRIDNTGTKDDLFARIDELFFNLVTSPTA